MKFHTFFVQSGFEQYIVQNFVTCEDTYIYTELIPAIPAVSYQTLKQAKKVYLLF